MQPKHVFLNIVFYFQNHTAMTTIFSRAGRLAVALLLAAAGLSAQTSSVSDDLARADKQYNIYLYNLARYSYEQVLKKDPKNAYAQARVGDCYFQLNRPAEALDWYEKAVKNPSVKPDVQLRYAKAQMLTGDYAAAKKTFRLYSEGGDQVIAEHYIAMCDYATTAAKKESNYTVKNEPLNSEAADYSPAFMGNRVVFNSARSEKPATKPGKATDDSGSDMNQLYVTQRNPEGTYLQKPVLLRGELNARNEGPVAYSANGQRVAFCRNKFLNGVRQVDETTGFGLNIYTAEVVDGNWTNIRQFPYNDSYPTGFPTLSEDGRTMLFASIRPGGFGGWDIYVSNWVSGEWSAPRNLGSPLNTQGNEITPFYDGNNLYFSSDWHRGFGGQDVFRAELGSEEIKNIYHLGPIVNSSYDDYGFIFNSEQRLGYLTSTRPGGRGNEDIWQVVKKTADAPAAYADNQFGKNQPHTPAQYNTNNPNPAPAQYNTNGVFAGTVYDGYSSAPMADAVVYARSTTSNHVLQTKTDNSGRYQLALAPYQEYAVTYAQNGYNDVQTSVKTDRVYSGTNELPEVELRAGSSDLMGWLAQNTPAQPTQPAQYTTTTNPTAATAQPGYANGYSVQLATGPHDYSNAYARYADLTPYGTLYTRYEDGRYKLRLGVYATRSEADAVVSQILRKHDGAFTVVEPNMAQEMFVKTAAQPSAETPAQYNTPAYVAPSTKTVAPYTPPTATTQPAQYNTPSTSAVSLITPKKVEVEKAKDEAPLTGYSIQVAASPEPFSESKLAQYEDLSKQGNLYTKQEDGATKLRLGIFTTKIKAQEAMKQVVKNPKAKNAFVVEEHGADDGLVLRDAAEALAATTPAQYAAKTALTTPPTAPNLNTPIRYAVQLGSFSPDKSIAMGEFAKLDGLGNVYTKMENGLNKVRLGVWASHDNADAAKTEAIKRGFQDATIVTEKAADPSLQNFLLDGAPAAVEAQKQRTGAEAPAPAVYSTPTTVKPAEPRPYYIRLAALSNPDNFDPRPYQALGGIEKRPMDNGMTMVLLGGYTNLESATSVQNQLRDKGYLDAYVVKDEKGKLGRVK